MREGLNSSYQLFLGLFLLLCFPSLLAAQNLREAEFVTEAQEAFNNYVTWTTLERSDLPGAEIPLSHPPRSASLRRHHHLAS